MYNMDERCWVSSYEQMLLQSRPPRLLQLLQQYLYRLHHLHFLGEKKYNVSGSRNSGQRTNEGQG